MQMGITNKLTQTVAIVASAFFIFGMFAYAANTAMSLPTVYFSHPDNECVKVDNYTDVEYTCDNLPKRFYHVWVAVEEVEGRKHQAGEY